MAVAERIDARRNRARLVRAARELFARRGVDASVRGIAREAGVGVATVYRHFPTRDELLDAVLEEAFEQLVAAGERALAEPDAWAGFAGFVEELLALTAENRGLEDAVGTGERGRERAESMRRRIWPLVAALVDRAQAQGALRADFAAQDLALLLWGGEGVIEHAADVAPELWRRQLGLVLDGLRASAATPLRRPALSDAELRQIRRGRRARRPSARRTGRR